MCTGFDGGRDAAFRTQDGKQLVSQSIKYKRSDLIISINRRRKDTSSHLAPQLFYSSLAHTSALLRSFKPSRFTAEKTQNKAPMLVIHNL